jgi:hypothetical protein
MKMLSKKRALDKIYKRRDRYEIPDWQRDEVWQSEKKQQLIDTILQGWRLPKFYFVNTNEEPEEFEVVDGQQRLTAIFEFFDNQLALSNQSVKDFGGPLYKDLRPDISDAFDDFEIEYDEITEATEQELKGFFQRLQQGLPLRSSEKLNAIHSALRNFCRQLVKHNFFATKIRFADKRYAYFDVASKVASIEIEGLETGLRFDDIKAIFESQENFSAKSAVGKRILATLDFVDKAFPAKAPELRNRSLVQSFVTLAGQIVRSGNAAGFETKFYGFMKRFVAEYTKQVELGLNATDQDYVQFQRTINANVRGAAKIRHGILLRKLLRIDPSFGNVLDPSVVTESGLTADIQKSANSIGELIEKVNTKYAAKHGEDLIKATNKTNAAVRRIGKAVRDYNGYKDLMSDLYFLFREGVGTRLATPPSSFVDINLLRTDIQHDVDHGKKKDVAKKRQKISSAFGKYAASGAPITLAPERFPLFQASLLAAVEKDMCDLLART